MDGAFVRRARLTVPCQGHGRRAATRALRLALTAVTAMTLAAPGRAHAKAKAKASTNGGCAESEGRSGDPVRIWVAPAAPDVGRSLNILAVAEDDAALGTEIAVVDPSGKRAMPTAHRRGGPPFSLEARTTPGASGRYKLEVVRGGKTVACRVVEVVARPRRASAAPRAPAVGAWAATRGWDRDVESFYAAWIESLFDAPVADTLGFRPLAEALRDPQRNWMFDYLGLGEDNPKGKSALRAAPDCADLPYFLRAYFSWKMGLPFGFRDCDRGTDKRPPRCGELRKAGGASATS